MKSSHIYILCIVAFLAILFAIEYNTPKKFVWRPTFSHNDRQPFGCAVFDDIVSASVPDYAVTHRTIYQLANDSLTNTGILAISQSQRLIDVERDAILDMAARGNKFMLVTSNIGRVLEDTLGVKQSYDYFSISSMRKYVNGQMGRDSIIWEPDSTYAERVFTSYPHLSRSCFVNPDSSFTVLARKNYLESFYRYDEDTDTFDTTLKYFPPVAIVKKVGKGEIILVATPLLFTNYGMLDADNSDFIFRLLSRMQGMPIIRTEAYTGVSEEQQTPLRYFLSQVPLRWALYFGILVLLLFIVFTARRRQRSIPVVRDPQNRSVEFVQMIGALYFQRKDHTDLVKKKIMYFAETLRRTIQVDIEDESDDHSLIGRMSQKTGMDETKIRKLVNEIRFVIHGTEELSDVRMRNIVDRINEIINNL